jgi:hypothetical protein
MSIQRRAGGNAENADASANARQAIDANMSEFEFQKLVEELATRLNWLCFHDNDSRRNNAGFPDCVFAHPTRAVVIYAELKTERGRLSHAQTVWRDALVLSGARWYLWRPSDYDEVVATLKGAE